jgi:uncharacterized Zn-binding protein involved in type VI secretion
MAGEIIRKGDPTSHGGTVLEGSVTDICMGQPIACINHKVYCPLCKGTFPIVEGITTTTFYGKGVAVAGMKTACGAVLIATQFTDSVDWSSGRTSVSPQQKKESLDTGIGSDTPHSSNLQNQLPAKEEIQSTPTDWIKFDWGSAGLYEGISCVVHFNDGSQSKGVLGEDNLLHFPSSPSSGCKKVEILDDTPATGTSLTDTLLGLLK